MDYFPIFCRLQGRNCLLVGGGEVAERKARLLIETGAVLSVNALRFTQQFHDWAKEGRLTLSEGAFDENLLNGCWLVIAATDDSAVNQQICEAANARQIFCNIVDAPKAASFIMPAIIDRSPLVVAVASSGMAPVLSRLLREKLEALLPQYLGNLAAYAGKLRRRVKKHFALGGERRRFWEKLFQNDRLAQALAHSDKKAVEALTDQLFKAELSSQGEVALVGAGPGSPDLLTLKGLQKIQQADVIVHDRLVTPEMMALARRDAERVFVGKCAGHHCVPQAEINQLLCRYAKQGKRVVRLKGGDPFIFGRGGEELEALCNAGIPISVVPGITAASGCAAYAGIPLTHRDYAQSVRLVTGHFKKGGDLDWQHLASEEETLVFYMGVSQAAAISEKLMMFGMPAEMPAAVIEKGTTAQQRVLIGELSQLGALAQQAATPALIIIGQVVKLSEKFNWFSKN